MIDSPEINSGAEFSEDRKYRYALWRIWDESKPLVMFIGLNPSTANESDNDPTIRSVIRISKALGYGGCYMMNCFPFISTNPDDLRDVGNNEVNDFWLKKIAGECKTIIFAWGNFDIVIKSNRCFEMTDMFGDEAMVLRFNKNGSPAHPLYIPSNIVLQKAPKLLRF